MTHTLSETYLGLLVAKSMVKVTTDGLVFLQFPTPWASTSIVFEPMVNSEQNVA